MGLFRPFINGVQPLEDYQRHESHPELDKPFTPADALTISRPILAAKAARMLVRGEVGVTPVVIAMAATDMEGKLARLIDKLYPGSGWGSTAHGAPWDTYADTLALLTVGQAALLAPRVSKPAKAAMGLVLAQEGYKASWAFKRNRAFRESVRNHEGVLIELKSFGAIDELPALPKKLELPTSLKGKESMAEKLTAAVAAVATNDFDNALLRSTLGTTAMAFATAGVLRGEAARREYEPVIDIIMNQQAMALHDTEAQLLSS